MHAHNSSWTLSTNEEFHEDTFKHNNVKRSLQKWILISIATVCPPSWSQTGTLYTKVYLRRYSTAGFRVSRCHTNSHRRHCVPNSSVVNTHFWKFLWLHLGNNHVPCNCRNFQKWTISPQDTMSPAGIWHRETRKTLPPAVLYIDIDKLLYCCLYVTHSIDVAQSEVHDVDLLIAVEGRLRQDGGVSWEMAAVQHVGHIHQGYILVTPTENKECSNFWRRYFENLTNDYECYKAS